MWAGRPRAPGCSPLPESLPTGTGLGPFQRPGRSLKADWLDERPTSMGLLARGEGGVNHAPGTPERSGWSPPPSALTRRGRHHPRPGIYNAVLRSDLWALPALGTGHRLGIQNAPAGGPSQITDHHRSSALPTDGRRGRDTATRRDVRATYPNKH